MAVWLGSTMSMHKERRKKKKKKTRRSDININDAFWEGKKKQGWLENTHFWPGSFVIVALLSLSMTCTCNKEQRKKTQILRDRDGGCSLFLSLSCPEPSYPVLCCMFILLLLMLPLRLLLLSTPLLLLIRAIGFSACLKVAAWKDG